MEYKTIYCQWENKIYTEDMNPKEYSQIEYNENIKNFENLVQKALDEGWMPLGGPNFSRRWLKDGMGGVAIQAMIRDKEQKAKIKNKK